MEKYDLIIVGAGPAGLSAALNASYLKMNFLVIESTCVGGILSSTYPWKKVENYLGFEDLTGVEAAQKMIEHVKSEGVKIKKEEVVDIKKGLKVITNKNKYSTKTVILTIGSGGTCRKLGIKGEGLKIVEYVLTEPRKYKNKKVVVIGGGDTALEYAYVLKKAGSKVTLIHRKDSFRATDKNRENIEKAKVKIMWNTEVKEIIGKKVFVFNNKTKSEQTLNVDSVFMCLGVIPNTDFLKKIGLKLDKSNNVVVDKNMRTNIKGVFAAGDVTGLLRRIPNAIGEGSVATFSAFKYIHNPYWA